MCPYSGCLEFVPERAASDWMGIREITAVASARLGNSVFHQGSSLVVPSVFVSLVLSCSKDHFLSVCGGACRVLFGLPRATSCVGTQNTVFVRV